MINHFGCCFEIKGYEEASNSICLSFVLLLKKITINLTTLQALLNNSLKIDQQLKRCDFISSS